LASAFGSGFPPLATRSRNSSKYFSCPGGTVIRSWRVAECDKWNELSSPYKLIVGTASSLANEWALAKYDANNLAALKRLVSSGAQLRPFNQAVLEASYKAANEIYTHTSGKNADFKKVYDSMVAFRGDEYLWWQVAEYAFDTFQIKARTRG
jgi:TRAP-type mannitol/chloroaromatic compound transport system substrate-binding protein